MAYLVSNIHPTPGFHPTSTSTIHLPNPLSPYASCTLYLYYILPPLLFVDTYELGQRSASYTFSHWGSRDVEKPVHALPPDPSEVLVNVKIPDDDDEEEDGATIRVEVPMHLRYGTPRPTGSTEESKGKPYEEVRVEWPQAFLLCPSSSSLKPTTSPPSLPAHILSALPSRQPRILIPIPPHSNFTETSETLLLPLGNPSDLAFVEPLTALTILVCCLWLLKVARRTARRLNTNARAEDVKVD